MSFNRLEICCSAAWTCCIDSLKALVSYEIASTSIVVKSECISEKFVEIFVFAFCNSLSKISFYPIRSDIHLHRRSFDGRITSEKRRRNSALCLELAYCRFSMSCPLCLFVRMHWIQSEWLQGSQNASTCFRGCRRQGNYKAGSERQLIP